MTDERWERYTEICALIWARVQSNVKEMDDEFLNRINAAFDVKKEAALELEEEDIITTDELSTIGDNFYCGLCVLAYNDCSECPGYQLWTGGDHPGVLNCSTPCIDEETSPYRVIEQFFDPRYDGSVSRDDLEDALHSMANFNYDPRGGK